MSNPLTHLSTTELSELLIQKTNLYNELISNDKSFEEVKSLFMEIRQIVRDLRQRQEHETSIFPSKLNVEEKATS